MTVVWEPPAPQPLKSSQRQRTYAAWSRLIDMHFGPDARSSPKDICERWLSFDNFLSDVGLKPEPTNEFRIVRIRESRPWRKDLAHVMDRADVGMVQRRGCASRRKRSSAWGLWATSSGRNLSATKRCRRVSSAL